MCVWLQCNQFLLAVEEDGYHTVCKLQKYAENYTNLLHTHSRKRKRASDSGLPEYRRLPQTTADYRRLTTD